MLRVAVPCQHVLRFRVTLLAHRLDIEDLRSAPVRVRAKTRGLKPVASRQGGWRQQQRSHLEVVWICVRARGHLHTVPPIIAYPPSNSVVPLTRPNAGSGVPCVYPSRDEVCTACAPRARAISDLHHQNHSALSRSVYPAHAPTAHAQPTRSPPLPPTSVRTRLLTRLPSRRLTSHHKSSPLHSAPPVHEHRSPVVKSNTCWAWLSLQGKERSGVVNPGQPLNQLGFTASARAPTGPAEPLAIYRLRVQGRRECSYAA